MSNKSYSAVVLVVFVLIAILAVSIIVLNELLGWPFAKKSDRDGRYGNRDVGIMDPETREPYYSKKKRY